MMTKLAILLLSTLLQFVLAQQSTSNFKVLVRSFYDGMTASKANTMNQLCTSYAGDFMASVATTSTSNNKNNNVRHLRKDSRELQNWCTAHCFSPMYGCRWCKLWDVAYGTNCDNVNCRRREEEEEEGMDDRDLQAADGLAAYVTDRNLFTTEQDEECAMLIASTELAADATNSKIVNVECYLVPPNLKISG